MDEGSFDLSLIRQEDHILEDLIQDEEKRLLLEAITTLPVHYKEVLDSVYFHLSDEEIGRSMGITKENVRQIRSRAKKQVMRLLEVKDHEGF